MRRSTSTARRACAVGTTIALIGLTTGLGIMTATSASALEPDPTVSTSTTSTPEAAPVEPTSAPSTDPAAPQTPAQEPIVSAPSAPSASEPPVEPPVPTSNEPASPSTTAPSTPRTPSRMAAATGTVSIDGNASVGSTLTAEPTGFTAPTSLSFEWSVGGVAVSQAQTYVVKAADGGKVVSVTVTNTQGGLAVESESAETAAITQAPAFVDENGKPITAGTTDDGDDLVIDATAGDAFSYTFRTVGYPKPTLALAFYYTDDEDDNEGATPADYLPEGVSFDPSTGVLSGSTEEASDYFFAVTATSGTTTITQTVDLTVGATAPVGIEAMAVDRQQFIDFAKSGFPVGWFGDDAKHSGAFTDWIIKADGSIVTEKHQYDSDADGGTDFSEQTDGGTPTVPQGGTLLLSGNLVDQFGNYVDNDDPEDWTTDIDVRSNVASDVVASDSVLGSAGFVGVTFPHASVHRLTVSAEDFSTSFDVQVTPAVLPTVPSTDPAIGVVQHGTIPVAQTTHGRLAYTGTDSTSALPWALGLVLAGIGLIGARTLRRRRAQR
ncbi:hypothetical protein DEJ28_06900 [Curtobacterium sp. MCPF17_002]|uniref:putative Ig domain-containing protein n=1 Tax=Curtobacterium sp. MCPF17_002 TaxID=2175645 RepID=UPI000DA7321C|nr:putative Ig domain-containing protein [Curtobacterium sp. MCPF17_002]WIB78819.1 hypothetical protein DEJ28_06900 [Curtobacterium sp. MCPF17_002]